MTNEPKTSAHENHNVLADEIVKRVCVGTAQAGGKPVDMLVLLESIVFGTAVVVSELIKTKTGEDLIDIVASEAKKRLRAHNRKRIIKP